MGRSGSLSRRDLLRIALVGGSAALVRSIRPDALTGELLTGPAVLRRRYRVFPGAQEYSDRTVRLMQESLVVDMLSPLTLDFDKSSTWLADPDALEDEDVRQWARSGIDAIHPAFGLGGPEAPTRVAEYLNGINGLVASRDEFVRVDSVDDFVRARDTGRVGVLLGVQNSEHFRTLDDIDRFHGFGQRVSQLTYNSRNFIGNGSTERSDDGLSDFGVQVVWRMNRVGMAIDVSHCGDRTTLDAIEASRRPVLITHSNCRALVPGHPRAKSDEAIEAMARSGGVMGLTAVRMFVRDREPTTIEHVLDHFDHVRDRVGIEHVGVGSDIDLWGYDAIPTDQNERLRAGYKESYRFRERIDIQGLDHPRRMFDLTEGLIRRGYTDDHARAVLGGNFVRALGEIWESHRPAGDPVLGDRAD